MEVQTVITTQPGLVHREEQKLIICTCMHDPILKWTNNKADFVHCSPCQKQGDQQDFAVNKYRTSPRFAT
jgi:hypothetical protein